MNQPATDGLGAASVRPRHIVHVAARYPPALGGMEKVVQYLARAQHCRGDVVRIVTSDDGQRGVLPEAEYFPVLRLRSFNILRTPLMPGLLRQLFRIDRASVVHLHVSGAYSPEMVWLYSQLTGHPYVVHSHGDFGPSGGFGSLIFRLWKPLVLRFVFRGARIVVVLTQADKATLVARFGVDPARIKVVPNGVDESFAYSGHRLIHDRPRLLFVGRLAAQKNLAQLLHALDGISDKFDTTLVGIGELEAELKELAQKLGLLNVRFYGQAYGRDLVALYRGADVFVLPSVVEGMPLALLEAMAMGLPVVATDIPGIRDLVVHGRNGLLVPTNNPRALRGALLSVVGDVRRYQQMSAGARDQVSEFSWEGACAKLDGIYAEMWQRPPKRASASGQCGS